MSSLDLFRAPTPIRVFSIVQRYKSCVSCTYLEKVPSIRHTYAPTACEIQRP